MINGLARLGATVVHQGNAKVHVSGHASAGELLFLYNALRPEQRHAGARRMAAPAGQRASWRCAPGVPEDNVVLAEDGVVVDLVDGKASHHRAGRGRHGVRRRAVGRRRR